MDQTVIFREILDRKKKAAKQEMPTFRLSDQNQGGTMFNKKLRELVSSITNMRDYLEHNKKDYLNIYSSILSMSSSMTDEERDQIDRDVQHFVKLSNDVIKILRVESKSKNSPQQFEHENAVINMVESYIKTINDMHQKQKALRLRRNLDSQNFFRLSRSLKPSLTTTAVVANGMDQKDQATSTTRKRRSPDRNNRPPAQNNRQAANFLADEDQAQREEIDPQLSPEEMKLFKMEGNRLYDEMNLMNEEVKNIAKKLTEISKLQEVFSENVLKQDSDLTQLNQSTIQSTEYIRDGNEQLREAMRKNAGFRVWILFFITTLAFVVLFLDWYNN